MIMMTVYPIKDAHASVHADVTALAQTLHYSLYGKYKIHIALSDQYAIQVETKRSDSSDDEVLVTDIPLEGGTLDIQIIRKEDLWNNLAYTLDAASYSTLQIDSPRQCKLTIQGIFRVSLQGAYTLLHFVHTSLGMHNTVLDYYGNRELNLHTEEASGTDLERRSHRLIFRPGFYEPSNN